MSSVKIGKRVDKTDENPHGWEYVDKIPYDEACVIYLGGDGATNGKAANGYAKIIQNEILKPIGADIPVYGIEYDFGEHNKSYARKLDFLKHRTALFDNKRDMEIKQKASSEEYNPQYIEQLFEKVMLPRISLFNGRGRLSTEEACRRIRRLNVVAHCHGGFVALKLEDKMQKTMAELGYNPEERKQIQSQLLVVAHAPACALGVSKSQFVSFSSSYDLEVPSNGNTVEVYIKTAQTEERKRFAAEEDKDAEGIAKNNWFDFKPSFFENKKHFMIKQKYEWNNEEGPFMINTDEHNNVSYRDNSQTKEGKMLAYFSRAILQNGIKNALENAGKFVRLPSFDELILPADKTKSGKVIKAFETMKENGRAFRQKVCRELIESRTSITAKNLAVREALKTK